MNEVVIGQFSAVQQGSCKQLLLPCPACLHYVFERRGVKAPRNTFGLLGNKLEVLNCFKESCDMENAPPAGELRISTSLLCLKQLMLPLCMSLLRVGLCAEKRMQNPSIKKWDRCLL